jgi:hypothetical protein
MVRYSYDNLNCKDAIYRVSTSTYFYFQFFLIYLLVNVVLLLEEFLKSQQLYFSNQENL